MPETIYNLSFAGIDGAPLPLSAYKGKVLLMVNTASKCGFTGQYAGLQNRYDRYEKRGFRVIGMPCKDFGTQEPACAADIKTFTDAKFNVTFPLTDKVHVKGDDAHPLFGKIRKQFGFWGAPHWNFYKYIVGRDGVMKTWFSPLSGPDSSALVRAIEAELNFSF